MKQINWRDALQADERLRERKKMKQAYKRGMNVQIPQKEARDAPEGTRCTWCRNLLSSHPRGLYTSNDKVVQLNKKEWAHYACYVVNDNPGHAYGFAYHESAGGGRWQRRK